MIHPPVKVSGLLPSLPITTKVEEKYAEKKAKYNLLRVKEGVKGKQRDSAHLTCYYLSAFFLTFILFVAVSIVVLTFTAYSVQYNDGLSFSFFLGNNNLAFASSFPAPESTAIEKEKYIDNDPIILLSDSGGDSSSFSSTSSSFLRTTAGKMTTYATAVASFKLTTSSPFTTHTSAISLYTVATTSQYEHQYQYQLQQQQRNQQQNQQQYRTEIGSYRDNGRSAITEPSSMAEASTVTATSPSLTSSATALAPTLNVPADSYVEATSSAGARVNYVVTAATSASVPRALDSVTTDRNHNYQQQQLQERQSIPISPVCSPHSGSLFPVGTTTVTCSATDIYSDSTKNGGGGTTGTSSSGGIIANDGKSVTKSFKIVVRDTTAPILTFPANNLIAKAASRMATAVSYSTHVSASDTVAGTVTPVCSPHSGSLFPVGTTTVTCSATDTHGNSATGSFGIAVRYPIFGGFLEPINSDGSSTFKLGSTIPVRFQLKWSDGQPVLDAKIQIYNAKISDEIIGANLASASTYTLPPTSGNYFLYDSSNGQYVFKLGTERLSAGTWQIKIVLDDGSTHTVNVSLAD